jgi:hypothetical protein
VFANFDEKKVIYMAPIEEVESASFGSFWAKAFYLINVRNIACRHCHSKLFLNRCIPTGT